MINEAILKLILLSYKQGILNNFVIIHMKKSQIAFPLIMSLCISAQRSITNHIVDKASFLAIRTICKKGLLDSMYLLKVLTKEMTPLKLMYLII